MFGIFRCLASLAQWLERHVDIVEVTGSNPVGRTLNHLGLIISCQLIQFALPLPDNTTKEFSKGTTGMAIAESISANLARVALSITVNGEIWDLDRPIREDARIQVHTWDDQEGKYTFWHSSAHLLAEAIQELFPSAKFGIGPPIENGFYYDVDFGNHTPQQEDLRALERKFLELARQKNKFSRISISKSDALTHYQKIGNEYKVDLIEGLENVEISFYKQGSFTDLCRGPHVPNTGIVKAVALTSIAGAYWRRC